MNHDDPSDSPARAERPSAHPKPELLAPAGDEACLAAALAAGADAVYFGLDSGFNARARASNFALEGLPNLVARIHRAGARAYLALNTLVFESELRPVEAMLRRVAAAGVDALIVQDPGLALLAHATCPELELHASTQMTISSPEGAAFAKTLGVRRIVAPRELSTTELRRLAEGTDLKLEVFIHGALCVSWSGQCLTSEAWGGRSANRGQCAQSCRLPYDLIVDGEWRDLGDVLYLLSPKDLSGMRAVEALRELGVASLKIEGRQKGPAYVATAVEGYRALLDAADARAEAAESQARANLSRMALAYTRGFSDGFLAGDDHQSLVEGRFPKHRGLYLGRVLEVAPPHVVIERDAGGRPWTGALAVTAMLDGPEGQVSAPLSGFGGHAGDATGPAPAEVEVRAGMGVVFDDGRPADEEEGGPIFAVAATSTAHPGTRPLAPSHARAANGAAPSRAPNKTMQLTFGTPGPDLRRVAPGQRVWLTSDPAVTRDAERASDTTREPTGRIPVKLRVAGDAGAPLRVWAALDETAFHGAAAWQTLTPIEATSELPLSLARGAGLHVALLQDKLGAFGGTPFRVVHLDTTALATGLHLPVSALKQLRRVLVDDLRAAIDAGPTRGVNTADALDLARARQREATPGYRLSPAPDCPPRLIPLCRNDAQLDAVLAAGLPEVELDWMELVGLARAVERARAAGLRVGIATVRVQKPGEEAYDARIAKLEPDSVLVRHWGALMGFLQRGAHAGPKLHGDFSLNVTNALTAHHLLGLGLDTLTLAHDLDRVQASALLDATPRGRLTVTLHHHIATFHTEHCVYAHLLSNGRDHHTCGRPCEAHAVSLRDRVGQEHPVIVDVGCRNTVFNAKAQSAASLVPELLARGVRRFRVEFVREDRAEAERVLDAYAGLLAGRLAAKDAVRQAGLHEQFGVTRGTMTVLQP